MQHKKIIEIACQVLKIEQEKLLSISRKEILVFARCIISDILYHNVHYTVQRLGRVLNRDHSTISHYLVTHKGNYSVNYNKYRYYYNEIKNAFKNEYYLEKTLPESITDIETRVKVILEDLAQLKRIVKHKKED